MATSASIHSFDQLMREFEANILASTRPKPAATSQLGMRQKEGKPLGLYLARFMREIGAIPDDRATTHVLEEKNGESQACHPPALQRPAQFYLKNGDSQAGFQRDYGHDTEECYDLKNQIEDLIRWGHLDRFVRRLRESSLRLKGPVEKQICVIVGGPTASDDSSSTRKVYARAEVHKRPYARGDPGITFESEGEYPNHNDALVITPCVANTRVKCIMIDTGSSADILYFDAFLKLDMINRDLVPMASTLTRFTRDAATLVGIAILPMTFDDEPRTKTLMVSFVVVELPSAYDVIIRRSTLNNLRPVISTYHRNIKFQPALGLRRSGATPESRDDATWW
ncbi:hypothetical protein B296_00040626 [Ensete ventricosum]|uniref:Retrotransposon gag domain-containing protein n=1 Tax=Ensete ventricosum TaxID=4639 RepID=A0A426X840_ENSVE|nr:hypothetical protein B296_00040626 [Ensete ventricosum]